MNRLRSALWAATLALVAAGCTGGGGAGGAHGFFQGASDCSVDVSPQLNEFIAALPDGGTLAFEPGTCYRIDGTVRIEGKRDLTIEGNGVTLKAGTQGDQTRKLLDFEGGGGFLIRNLVLVGAHPSGGPDGYVRELEGQHGMNFGGVDGAEVVNVSITGVYGDFMRFAKGKGEEWTRNVVVTGSNFEGSGRQGTSFAAASNIRIEGNRFDGIARSVFDIEPNGLGGGAQGLSLVDNEISNWGNLVLPVGGKGEVSDISLIGSRLFGKQLDVFFKDPREAEKDDGGGLRRSNISIIGNVSDTPAGQAAINLTSVDGAVVRDNVQPFRGDDSTVAVKVTASCDVEILDNVFEGAQTQVEQDDYPCP